ncbi:MAG: AAA family ATPase [Victivallaceae bacterium]
MQQHNNEVIVNGLKYFFQPGDVFEIRCLDATVPGIRHPHTESGYFDYEHIDSIPKYLAKIEARGIYFTPNPVNPALLARAANRIKQAGKNESTADTDILCRRWLLIDCDAVRASGISASDKEHKLALAKAAAIHDRLTSTGFPEPVMIDSGNGAQLMYRIDDATADEGLIRNCLKALDSESDKQVKIDLSVHNPARIWRLPGTWNCKGDEIDDRVYRQARIISRPETIQTVSHEKLHALAYPVTTSESDGFDTNTPSGFDLGTWIAQYCPEAEGPESWKDGRRWIFPVCPFNEAHNNRSAVIIQQANGAVGFKCHHDGCAGKDWHDLRKLREPERTPTPAGDVDLSILLAKILGNYKPVAPDNAMPSKTASEIIGENDIESPDPNELVKHRFICRNGGLLLVGPSGYGKSSFLTQAALMWAMGEVMMGLEPVHPLKILMIQAENDDRDVAEQLSGAINGYLENYPNADQAQLEAALKSIDYIRESSLTGEIFIRALARKLASYSEGEQRDMVIIDPLFAYCGCDVSDQGEMSKFLRNWLNPVIEQNQVGLLICHHANKPPKDAGTSSALSLAYAGSGTAELTNWARAVLVISPDAEDETLFAFTAAKRGKRLKWPNGSIQKFMRHAHDGTIFWSEAVPPANFLEGKPNNEELLAMAVSLAKEEHSAEPVADYLVRIQFDLDIGRDKARILMQNGIERGALATSFRQDENNQKKRLKYLYRTRQKDNLLFKNIRMQG